MRIGIDIDDTITNTWECYMPYYSEIFGIPTEELIKDSPYYGALKNMVTLPVYYEKINPLYDKLNAIVPLKNNVKEIIDKLYEDGHKIIFITNRGKGYTDSYKSTKEYLEYHQIKYDKLIVKCIDKGQACLDEKIDLFIDDSISHCESAANRGINVLMFKTRFNQEYPKFNKIDNWEDIYKYIKNMGE